MPLWAMELAADIFLGAWLFFIGASVGSFLNVVVYRLPRGINLVHPGSRCPSCLHPIRLRDNVPVLSWLCSAASAAIAKARDFVAVFLGRAADGERVSRRVAAGSESPQDVLASSDPVRRPLDQYNLAGVLVCLCTARHALRHGSRRCAHSRRPLSHAAALCFCRSWSRDLSCRCSGRRSAACRPLTMQFREPWQAGGDRRHRRHRRRGAARRIGIVLRVPRRAAAGRCLRPVMLMASLGVVLGWQRMLLVLPAIVLLYRGRRLRALAPGPAAERARRRSAEPSTPHGLRNATPLLHRPI